jgi:DNA helicase-2/ATP-dependent DNA helicase PcrA
MAKRRFKLPGIQDLSKEQEDARALPLDGQHLIIGGPGTGKSVLALLRARRLSSENSNYIFLVFNHLLHQSSYILFGKELACAQWQAWFKRIFFELTGQVVPLFAAKPGTNWREYNWNLALEIASNADIKEGYGRPYLVIDEGQDMPPAFYQCLANLGFENFFVVADQNQQIVDGENSSIRDIWGALGEPEEIIELKANYRNKYPVARLAREFYTGDPASPPPELPAVPSARIKIPMLYAYPSEVFPGIIRRIAKMADRMPAKLIGVISPNNNIREEYFLAIKDQLVGLDNSDLVVSTFKSGDRHQMAFDEGGIMVINAQACKGLEFDIVFIAGLHKFRVRTGLEQQAKRLFYVMVARAVDQVIMLQAKGSRCEADMILPTDITILERR